MKLMVLTAAVFPSEEDARKKLWIFLKSCEKFGIEPHFYGIGRAFPGYRALKLDFQLEYLKDVDGDYTHVLYTDSWDAFFCAPLTEIIAKYEQMGAPPILVSAAHQAWPREQGDDESYGSKTYRYPHVGGYIAEIPAIIDAFERMLKLPRQAGDDCFNWFDAWQEGWFRPQVDSECQIFQVGDANAEWIAMRNSTIRVRNTITGSYPCILHLPGGFTHQRHGKDATMIPWAERLGILMTFEQAWVFTEQCPGSFTRLSGEHYYRYALQVPPGEVIVEVGVDQGRSASLLLRAANLTGARLILVDSWESVLIDNLAKVLTLVSTFPEVKAEIIHARSVEAAKRVPGPIAMVHIDANHYDDNPANDCEAWLPKLKSGGIACFHDFQASFPAVTAAVDKYTAGWQDLGVFDGLAIRRKS